jgi:serine/threonine protein phosphatase PrpC
VSSSRRIVSSRARSAIGDCRYKKVSTLTQEEQAITALPDIKTVELQGDDHMLVLGCDGVWDVKSNEEVIELIHPLYEEGLQLSRGAAGAAGGGAGAGAGGAAEGGKSGGKGKNGKGAKGAGGKKRKKAGAEAPEPEQKARAVPSTDGEALEQICEVLLDACLAPTTGAWDGYGCDNTSAVIVRLGVDRKGKE